MVTKFAKHLLQNWPVQVLFFILSLLAASCNSKEHTSNSMQIEKIEMDVFSGRPNPSWTVTAAETAALQPHFLKETVMACGADPDMLGYKGFIITAKPSATAPAERIRVFAGKLWYYSNPLACYKDAHQLESLLIKQAKEKGYGQLMKDVGL